MTKEYGLDKAQSIGRTKALFHMEAEPYASMNQAERDAWWVGWRNGKRHLSDQLKIMIAAAAEVETYPPVEGTNVSVPSYDLGD